MGLLGPPELRRPPPSSATQLPLLHSTGDNFMDLMMSQFNSTEISATPEMGKTANGSATYLTTGNPCLDFFYHVVPYSPSDSIRERLQASWEHDPLTTLKLICNLRGVRGFGKANKEGYYTAALWLHQLHPKTFACNLPTLAGFGYFKDLPEILYRALEGSDVRQRQKLERRNRSSRRGRFQFGRRGGMGKKLRAPFQRKKGKKRQGYKKTPKEIRISVDKQRAEVDKAIARKAREQNKVAAAKKAVERYSRDPDYKFLHDRISDFFADYLRRDLELLKSGELKKISVAAKWCPSLDSAYDKSTLLCESIAMKLFPREEFTEYEGVDDAHYAYRVRDRLRKQVLVPLRKALELPESYIGANDWGSVRYHRVASVAMRTYKEKFMKHDKERFEEYLGKAKEGKAKVAAGALMPHEIIKALYDDDGGQLAELQWKRTVDDLSAKGKLKNCLALCDVSEGMNGTAMEVSVALGILLSELSEGPWQGKLVTFSQNPALQMIVGQNLRTKIEFVRRMDWGSNTNFQKVFDLILQVAVNGNLKEDQMIKRIFVFSNMEFDQVSSNPWETDYMMIVKKFKEKGYGNCVPQIVFWNLRDSTATPVPRNQQGVALVSGFSKNLLKLFLEEGGDLNPESVMEAAIAGEEFQNLVVLD